MATATREAYGQALAELIVENPNVFVLDADLTKSTKTALAKKACPQRHYNMGIAEGNMMSVAAGIAASGKIVYASSFAMFAAGRAYEQVRNSIGYPHLNVKICATHAGISVGEDGASHQCIEDLGLMRGIPGMHVFQPCDAAETKAIIKGIASLDGPCYVRLGRSGVEDVFDENYVFEPGKGKVIQKGEKVALVATGMLVQEVIKASKHMDQKPTIVDMSCIKPIDEELLIDLAKTHDVIITCEEHNVINGLYGAVCECLAPYNLCKIIPVGVKDTFGESGKPKDLMKKYGLTSEAIEEEVQKVWND